MIQVRFGMWALVATLVWLGACTPTAENPGGTSDTPDEPTGVLDAMRMLGEKTGKTVAVDPLAQPIAECARLSVFPRSGAKPDELLKVYGEAVEAVGLILDVEGDTIKVGFRSARYLPPECEKARPVRQGGSSSSYLDRPRPPLRDRLSSSSSVLDRGDAGVGTGRRRPGDDGTDYTKLIVEKGENSYEISRSLRDDAMSPDNNFKFMRQARMVPSFRDGKPNGLKFYGIRPGSVYAALGIRNGDTIASINNLEISDPESALEAYKSIKKARRIQVELIRRGRPLTLNYKIVKE